MPYFEGTRIILLLAWVWRLLGVKVDIRKTHNRMLRMSQVVSHFNNSAISIWTDEIEIYDKLSFIKVKQRGKVVNQHGTHCNLLCRRTYEGLDVKHISHNLSGGGGYKLGPIDGT